MNLINQALNVLIHYLVLTYKFTRRKTNMPENYDIFQLVLFLISLFYTFIYCIENTVILIKNSRKNFFCF